MTGGVKKYIVKLVVVLPSLVIGGMFFDATGSGVIAPLAGATAASLLTMGFTYLDTKGVFRPSLGAFWRLEIIFLTLPLAALAFALLLMYFLESPWWAILFTAALLLLLKACQILFRRVVSKLRERQRKNAIYDRYGGRY